MLLTIKQLQVKYGNDYNKKQYKVQVLFLFSFYHCLQTVQKTMPIKYIMEAILNTKIKENKELQNLISFFDFKPCLSKKFPALSGGQKQKFTIIIKITIAIT